LPKGKKNLSKKKKKKDSKERKKEKEKRRRLTRKYREQKEKERRRRRRRRRRFYFLKEGGIRQRTSPTHSDEILFLNGGHLTLVADNIDWVVKPRFSALGRGNKSPHWMC